MPKLPGIDDGGALVAEGRAPVIAGRTTALMSSEGESLDRLTSERSPSSPTAWLT